jgi:exopolysaccharide biosynthesis polyprenyl glycosylphosphotransferase
VAVLVTAFVVAAKFNTHGLSLEQIIQGYHNLFLLSVTLFVGFSMALGVYRTITHITFLTHVFRAAKAYIYSTAVILSILFLSNNAFYTRFFLLLYCFLAPPLLLLAWTGVHWIITRLGERWGYGRWNTLAIGSDRNLPRLLRRMADHPELGYEIVDTLKVPQRQKDDGAMHVQRKAVETIVDKRKVQLILFASSNLNGSFDSLEELCRSRGVAMRVVSPDADYLFSRAGLHGISGIPLFTPARTHVELLKQWAKRMFDVVVAGLLLILFSPVFILIAIATKIESPGPVFFTQARALTDTGKKFRFYKFRSMYHEADEEKEHLLEMNESTGALFKIKDDPRLTLVGKFIRRLSFDELPQLLNVLKGDMSLVGPRPLPTDDFGLLRDEDHMGGYFRHRDNAKPGITGLWQISGRSDLGFREMVLLDLYYIEHQTILFDIEILLQTIPAVLFGKGAY